MGGPVDAFCEGNVDKAVNDAETSPWQRSDTGLHSRRNAQIRSHHVPSNIPSNQRFMQMCWVVPDIHAAMAAWTRSTGVGPFFFFDTIAFGEPRYRGKPTGSIDITAALDQRSEERQVGKERGTKCRSRWLPAQSKNTHNDVTNTLHI